MNSFDDFRKLVKNINNKRQDFLKSPAFYLQALLPYLQKSSLTLYNQAKALLDKENPQSIELDGFLSEVNLLFAENAEKPDIGVLKCKFDGFKGIGEKGVAALNKQGIETYEDILLHFPYKYDIFSPAGGDKRALTGELQTMGQIRTRRGRRMYKAVFRGDGGQFSAIWFHFSSKYPANALKKGETYTIYGPVSASFGEPSITHPEFLKPEDVGKIRPVYSLGKSVNQSAYRSAVRKVIEEKLKYMPDLLPVRLLDELQYPEIKRSIRTLHMPEGEAEAMRLAERNHKAYERFIFEELFYIQTGLMLKKQSYRRTRGISFDMKRSFMDEIANLLPFKLTGAQKSVLKDIFNDMKDASQMNRLIQGDVGSGKTIVAFICGLMAVKNGYQTAVIAPTEVLAEQHYVNLQKIIQKTGYTSVLLTGSAKNKSDIKQQIAAGHIDFIIGTHAVIQEDYGFANLGLAIIDEQHRFGVLQRKSLINKGYNPDILLMTATPIPRTLSLTFYGDLDISVIDELPPGRQKVITKAFSDKNISKVYQGVDKELSAGGRIYFIYPLVEASEKLEAKAAEDAFQTVKERFKSYNTGLIHGRMKGEDKRAVMNAFKDGDIQILVSTTVIEVGVDVPEASVMVIENAERFGLSQLHQLRGRVGRGERQSWCLLIYSDGVSEEGLERIDAMVQHADGFKLSEIDLKMRGAGDFFGTRQSGMPDFRFSNIVRDVKILKKARACAEEIIKNDETLEKPENKVIRETVINRWKDQLELFAVG